MLAGANRTRASNEQIIQLNRRGILNDEQAFAELRGNGVLEPFDRQTCTQPAKQCPQFPTLCGLWFVTPTTMM